MLIIYDLKGTPVRNQYNGIHNLINFSQVIYRDIIIFLNTTISPAHKPKFTFLYVKKVELFT